MNTFPFPADTDGSLPTIVCDTREQAPLVFTRLPSIAAGLGSADYSIAGLERDFGIERKTIHDLVACCMGDNRERFERELTRLRGFRFKRLLIVGSQADIEGGNYRSNIAPASVLATLAAFEVRFDLPVFFEATPQDAAARIESWACWYAREVQRSAARLTETARNIPAN